VIEQLRRVVGDDRDRSSRQPIRRAVPRAIEDEQANPEASYTSSSACRE
jgi:hypothetical protein